MIIVPPEVASGGSDGVLEEIADLSDEAIRLLLAQYQETPRIQALIRSVTDRAQELETAIVSASENILSLDSAEGVQLDLLGEILGEARDGRDDDPYRRALRVRVLVNRSDGTIEQLIAIILLFEEMSGTDLVSVKELAPARLEIRIVRDVFHVDAGAGGFATINTYAEILKRVKRAKAAGVALQVLFHPNGTDGSQFPFRFCRASDYPEKSDFEGFRFELTGDPGGGALAHVLE